MIDGTKEMKNLLEEIKRNMDSDGYFVDATNASFYLGALWVLSNALAKKEIQRRRRELVEQLTKDMNRPDATREEIAFAVDKRAKLEKEIDEQKGES